MALRTSLVKGIASNVTGGVSSSADCVIGCVSLRGGRWRPLQFAPKRREAEGLIPHRVLLGIAQSDHVLQPLAPGRIRVAGGLDRFALRPFRFQRTAVAS